MRFSGAQVICSLDSNQPYQRPSSATAAGNARSAATVANKLSEPSDCPAGRRFAAALRLGHWVTLSKLLSASIEVLLPMPPDAADLWQSRNRRMNGGDAIGLDTTLASTEQRTNQSGLSLKPSNPNCWVAAAGWAMADNKLVIGVSNSKTKIPTKVFLSWLGIGRDAASTKLLHQGASYVIATAAIVDEIIPALRRIERRTLKRNQCANICLALEVA